MPRSLGRWIFRGATLTAGSMPGTKPGKDRIMADPKPQRDPNPVGDPKPDRDPKPAGDPSPAAPGREIGDRPGNVGQHPGMPPEIDARKRPGTNGRDSSAQRPAKQPINDRNMAGDRGAREPASH